MKLPQYKSSKVIHRAYKKKSTSQLHVPPPSFSKDLLEKRAIKDLDFTQL